MKSLLFLSLLICTHSVINAQPWNTPAAGTIYYNGNVGIGTASPTEKLHVIGNLKVETAEIEGATGGMTVSHAGWGRPGATKLDINNAPIFSFDGMLHFLAYTGEVLTLSPSGFGPSTKRGFVVGKSPWPRGNNDSYALFNSSHENEYLSGAAYPSGENYFYIATNLNSPITSTNTNATAVRAPFVLDARYLRFNTGVTSDEAMRISENKNLLIGGVSDNGKRLQVNGDVWSTGFTLPTGASAGKVLTSDASGNATWQDITGGGSTNWSLDGTTMYNSNAGTVVIGSVPTSLPSDLNLKLAVNGNIYAKKLKVTATGWADYVFAPEYKLRPLKEVEEYIVKNKHLPEIPTAEEVKKNGIDVGENQTLLLKKIEELTLYIIEQERKIETLFKKLEEKEKH